MLGIQVDSLSGQTNSAELTGWNESQRAMLHEYMAARQAFLDFTISRINDNGVEQTYKVSGEPMFNRTSRFIGYRGVGVEITPIALESPT